MPEIDANIRRFLEDHPQSDALGGRPMGLELHVVDLGLDATDADLVEQMRHMEDYRTAGFKQVGCSIRGYGMDSRELWQIPEVVDFCKKLSASASSPGWMCRLRSHRTSRPCLCPLRR